MHTPEGVPLPPNTLAELQRDMARLGFVVSQIREIEDARQKRLEQLAATGLALPRGCMCLRWVGRGQAVRCDDVEGDRTGAQGHRPRERVKNFFKAL